MKETAGEHTRRSRGESARGFMSRTACGEVVFKWGSASANDTCTPTSTSARSPELLRICWHIYQSIIFAIYIFFGCSSAILGLLLAVDHTIMLGLQLQCFALPPAGALFLTPTCPQRAGRVNHGGVTGIGWKEHDTSREALPTQLGAAPLEDRWVLWNHDYRRC